MQRQESLSVLTNITSQNFLFPQFLKEATMLFSHLLHLCTRAMRSIMVLLLLLIMVGNVCSARSGVEILTHHNNNARTGANLHETILKVSNVNVGQFGKLYAYPVDGQIYAQPLYVPNLTIPGKGVHNVLFVATEHNSVYAFDADSPAAASTPLWQVNLGTSVPSPNSYFGNRYAPYVNITPEYGITGTPVVRLINTAPLSGTLYVVAFTQDQDGGPYHNRLHALDITTGQERAGSPVELAGSVPGTGYGSDSVDGILDRKNGSIILNNMQVLQRPALLLTEGIVYVALGSHSDTDPYHGWILAYNATTLKPEGIFCDTPNGNEGGLWQAGSGPAADGLGNVYFMVCNGSFDAASGNYGDSFVKLKRSGAALPVIDYFTPDDQATLEAYDIDLGSAGPLLIPGTNLLTGVGKEGVLYLLQRDKMGHYDPSGNTGAIQSFAATAGEMHTNPIYWKGPSGALVYVWSDYDTLKAFQLVNGLYNTTPFAQSAVSSGLSGGALSLSANGSTKGTGILWANLSNGGDAEHQTVPGILRAFDASNLNELWNSLQDPSRDDFGSFAKFCPPTVVNGKVYMATFSNQLVVYGLGNWVAPPTISPNGGTFYPTQKITLHTPTSGATIYYTTDGSDPTNHSTVYTGPFTLSNSATVKAKATKPGLSDSAIVSATFVRVKPGGVLSINFVGGGPNGDPSPMGAAEVAGVAAKPNWNNAASNTGSLSGLVNDLGTATTAVISWKSDNTWSTLIADTPGNYRMMKGYLDTGNVNPTTVQVSNLPASITANGYDVYIYVDGGYTTATRTGIYSIGSASISVTDPGGVDFSGTFILANNSVGNYTVISGVTGSSFTLTATPGTASDGVERAPLNAIQIVAR